MKNLLYAIGMILAGAFLLVLILPFEIVSEVKWRLSK